MNSNEKYYSVHIRIHHDSHNARNHMAESEKKPCPPQDVTFGSIFGISWRLEQSFLSNVLNQVFVF